MVIKDLQKEMIFILIRFNLSNIIQKILPTIKYFNIVFLYTQKTYNQVVVVILQE